MGGNVMFGDKAADRIDSWNINREKFTLLFEGLLSYINVDFIQDGNLDAVWDLSDGFVHYLSGSSRFLWEKPLNDLFDAKRFFGDIDIFVDKDKKKPFIDYMKTMKGYRFSRYFKLIDCKPCINQLICLFEYNDDNELSINVQVDFEFVDFYEGKPTNFSKFSHFSSWEDQVQGVKGVFHKYLIASILQSTGELPGYIVTPKSTKYRFNFSAIKRIPVEYSFSVSRGMKRKFNQQDWTIGGFPVWKLTDNSECHYTKNIEEIYVNIFGRTNTKKAPFAPSKFWSYTGILDLCERFDSQRIYAIYYRLNYIMFGEGSQKLSRTSADMDKDLKETALEVFRKHFPFLENSNEFKPLKEEYYNNY